VASNTGSYLESVTNTAEFNHLIGAGAAKATYVVEPLIADILISKSSIRNQEAGVISYTVVVQNLGPGDASGTVVSDTLPAGIGSFTWQCTPGGGAVCTPNGSDTINDTLTSFPAGGQVIYNIVATLVSSDATIINIAEFIAPPGLMTLVPNNSAMNISAAVGPVFLPVLLKDATPPEPPPPPPPGDLTVSNLVATSSGVTVTVTNQGAGPVVDAFWVDVYINPNPPPTGVNQVWPDLSDQGLVWGVEGAPPFLNPGESITLTIGGQYYFGPPFSSFSPPLAPGTPIYAQVDSFNLATNFGNVPETDEGNNITSTVSIAGASGVASASQGVDSLAPDSDLPPRP
jgi:hypothetical protein